MTVEFTDDLTSRAEAADDFGHSVHYLPSKVYYPTTDQEVSAIVKEARRTNDQIAVRGVGHSTNGQAQCCGCIVVSMKNMNQVREVTDDFIYVEAGAYLDVVYSTLFPTGKTTVAQTDWAGLSVGGVISGSGGSGPGLFRHGPLADSVLEMTIVTGNGNIEVVSPADELFYAAISSLGQFGIITAIKLQVVDIPGSKIRVYHVYQTLNQTFQSYQQILDDEANTGAPFDQFKSFPVLNMAGTGIPSGYPPSFTVQDLGIDDPWVYIQEIGVYFDPGDEPDDQAVFDYLVHINGTEISKDMDYADWIYRLEFLFNNLLPSVGFDYAWHTPHPWFGVIVPFEEARDYVADFFLNTPPEDAPVQSVQVMNIFKEPNATEKHTFKPLPDSNIDRLVYVAILRQVNIRFTPDLFAENARLTEVNRVHRINAEMIGGVPYLTSMIPSSKTEWDNLAGFDSMLYRRVKSQYDPHYIFQPSLTSMILGRQHPCERNGGGQFEGTI